MQEYLPFFGQTDGRIAGQKAVIGALRAGTRVYP